MRQHVKVLLASGIVENYYPESEHELSPGAFSYTIGKMSGFAFNREGSVDWWSVDMVKGIQISPFKGLLLQIEDEQIYCKGSGDMEIIESLQIHIADLKKRLDASQTYLSTKSADFIFGEEDANPDADGDGEKERLMARRSGS